MRPRLDDTFMVGLAIVGCVYALYRLVYNLPGLF